MTPAKPSFLDRLPDPDRPVLTPSSFRPLTELLEHPTRPRWLARDLTDILEHGVIGVMAGSRGAYKSFIALHWSMLAAVAGRRVAIVSAEGAGIDRRIRAWLMHYAPKVDPKSLSVNVLEGRVRLDGDAGRDGLIAGLVASDSKPELLVIDTFSKNAGCLDENSNSEVRAAIGRVDTIRRLFDCTVLIVAHTGHGDQRRARGASALEADTEAAYIVAKDAEQPIATVSRERFKDAPELEPLAYRAEIIDLGDEDEQGRPVTSLVMVTTDAPVGRKAEYQLKGKAQRTLLAALRERERAAGEKLIWNIADLRTVGREAGMHKNTARAAVEAVAFSPFLVPTVGGYKLTDE